MSCFECFGDRKKRSRAVALHCCSLCPHPSSVSSVSFGKDEVLSLVESGRIKPRNERAVSWKTLVMWYRYRSQLLWHLAVVFLSLSVCREKGISLIAFPQAKAENSSAITEVTSLA